MIADCTRCSGDFEISSNYFENSYEIFVEKIFISRDVGQWSNIIIIARSLLITYTIFCRGDRR